MTGLFGQPDTDTPAPTGPFAAVAMEQALDKTLDYAIPTPLLARLQLGQRVRVPLGRKNRPAHGYVVAIHPTTTYPRIKPMIGIDDERVLINPQLMSLARWMARYYCTPLGAVLENILPSAVRRKTGLGHSWMVRPALPRDQIQQLLEKTKAPKRRAILARLLQIEEGHAVELIHLAGEAGVKPPTIRKLVAMGVITIKAEADLAGFGGNSSGLRLHASDEKNLKPEPQTLSASADLPLNEDQQRVFDDLQPRLASGFSVNLLHGVTGSGKTEIYLQCIRNIIAAGKQAIVMVPEIALTPQTVRRFTQRFPRVAILHSGLSATHRHRFWHQVSTRQADVVVGARSAVFAPAPNLGMIVVDEEHEASYKQDTAPRYHGRDVAIKRAQLENSPILLGSATPSLEMYHRVGVNVQASGMSQESKEESQIATPPSKIQHPKAKSPYHLLSLPRRVRDLPMPAVEMIDMKQEMRLRRGGVHLLSTRLEHLLQSTLAAGHQAILLLNRRGYSNFIFCSSCQEALQCKYCDATLTYHRSAGQNVGSAKLEKGLHTGQLHCHYCLAVTPLPAQCPHCGKKLSLFGLGTQRVEEELSKKFPDLKYARVDSDTMRSSKDYEALLGDFAAKKIQVLLGTQMIAKGLDYPNVTLVGVISGDTALALPDFRAAERTFQLITQVAGRAGRGDAPGRVVLQTFLPDDPTILDALRQDYATFAQRELKHRKEVSLPPFSRMARIILRDQDIDKLHTRCQELAALLAESLAADPDAVQVKGPMPCAISRIAGHWRHQIVLTSLTSAPLQRALADLRKKGALKNPRTAVDVDPVSLL
jgi:primosomal protein N' (replication factor Y)